MTHLYEDISYHRPYQNINLIRAERLLTLVSILLSF